MFDFSERFGKPQIFAILLLLAFMAQAFAVIARTPLSPVEVSRFHGEAQADPGRSRLVEVLAGLPRLLHARPDPASPLWPWLVRLPFVFIGALLGASLWYVSRRLYGNAGGYVALALYAFSPRIISASAAVRPDIVAAWGAFGAIFTGIAVSHTLYAPREVVLWNWRRILLLGIALGVGTAALFSVAVAVPIALAFMLYLVPERKAAALTILGAACVVGFVLLLAVYGFSFAAVGSALHQAGGIGLGPSALTARGTYTVLGLFLLHNSPGLVMMLAAAVVTFVAWRRTRFFGTTAPLLTAVVLMVMAGTMPHQAGSSFLVAALPFLLVFIAGVCADLLETRYSGIALGIITGILLSHALFSISGLLSFP